MDHIEFRGREGSDQNWAGDLIADGWFVGRLFAVSDTAGQRLTLRDGNTGDIVADERTPQMRPVHEVIDWARENMRAKLDTATEGSDERRRRSSIATRLADRLRPAALRDTGVAIAVDDEHGGRQFVPVSPGSPVRHGGRVTFHFNVTPEIKARIGGRTVYFPYLHGCLADYHVTLPGDDRRFDITLEYLSANTVPGRRGILCHDWAILLWDPTTQDTFTLDETGGDDVGDYEPCQAWWRRPQADMGTIGAILTREGFQLVPPATPPEGARRTPRPLSTLAAREVLASALTNQAEGAA